MVNGVVCMDYEVFKRRVNELIGINLSYYKEKQMKRRIKSLISKKGYAGYYDYYNEIRINKELRFEFINYLTINVSEFCRNPDQWEILEKEIL